MKTGPVFGGEASKWQSVLYETKLSIEGIGGSSFSVSRSCES